MLAVKPELRPDINTILKHPALQSRIPNYLNEAEKENEFCHTVLHKQNVFA